MIISCQKNQAGKGLRLFREAITCLLMICVLTAISCKKDKTLAPSEKDTGIHEKFERGPAAVTLDIDRREISIAARLNLTIGVTVEEDYEVKLPGFGEKLEQFGIVDYHTSQPELIQNNKKKISRTYILEPFLSGEYTIPPMEVLFWKNGEQENEAHKIETTEVTIKVKSLLPEDLKDVKLNEIKPPVRFPRSYTLWIWTGIAAVIISIGVLLAFVVIKRRNQRQREGAGLNIPAHKLAYEELERLVSEGLPDKGEIKIFYQRISGIIRRYIENRFGLRAPEQTTQEFLAGLEFAPEFPDQYQTLLTNFLNHCDLVKFAEYQPGPEDIQKTFDSCKAFIEGTEEKE